MTKTLPRAVLPLLLLMALTGVHLRGQAEADTQSQAASSVRTDDSQGSSGTSKRNLPNPLEDPRDRIYYPGDTESVKPLTTKLVGNILLDQKEIWISPFRMHKKDAKWWIGFGAITAALIATDHQTSQLLENSRGQVVWAGRVSNIGAAYTLVPIVAGFYTFGVLGKNAQAREVGVLGAESLIDSLIVVTVLKTIAGRDRPDNPMIEDRGHFFKGGASFPSGHAIETWSLASLIAHEYKRKGGKFVPYLAYGLAAGVTMARFAAQEHYASDLVAGAAMGWFIGRYVYQTHEDHAGHQHAWAQPQLAPNVDPLARSYGLTLRFNP
jgi:membrane-associated phospholipid phosphatase